jgi:hypothetical protein
MSYISFHFWALQVTLNLHTYIHTYSISINPKIFTLLKAIKEAYLCMRFQGQYQNDLKGLLFDNQSPDLPKIPGEYILENIFQIDVHRSKWVDLSVIFSMIVIYRIIFFIMIKISEDITPWIRGYIAKRRMQQKNGTQNTTVAPDGLIHSPSLRNYVADRPTEM